MQHLQKTEGRGVLPILGPLRLRVLCASAFYSRYSPSPNANTAVPNLFLCTDGSHFSADYCEGHHPSSKVLLWRHNAQPQDSSRDSDAPGYFDPSCIADPRDGSATDNREPGSRQNCFTRAGGNADASPVLAHGGDVHPEFSRGQASRLGARRRQVLSRPRRTGERRGGRTADPWRWHQTQQDLWRPGELFFDGIPTAGLPANDLRGHVWLRPRALHL